MAAQEVTDLEPIWCQTSRSPVTASRNPPASPGTRTPPRSVSEACPERAAAEQCREDLGSVKRLDTLSRAPVSGHWSAPEDPNSDEAGPLHLNEVEGMHPADASDPVGPTGDLEGGDGEPCARTARMEGPEEARRQHGRVHGPENRNPGISPAIAEESLTTLNPSVTQ